MLIEKASDRPASVAGGGSWPGTTTAASRTRKPLSTPLLVPAVPELDAPAAPVLDVPAAPVVRVPGHGRGRRRHERDGRRR